MKITKELINKIDEGLSHGLSHGLGKPKPGEMCVEALICNVLSEPHNDKPSCVDPILNKVKIKLNDSNWSSNDARAKGLRNLAILQLGTKDNFDSKLFSDKLVTFTCTDFLPWFFEKMKYDFITETILKNLKEAKTFEEMKKAAKAAYAAATDAAYAAAAATDADANAAYAAYAAAATAAANAANADATAAAAAANAAYYADAAAAADYDAYYAAANSAYYAAANSAYYAASAAYADEILTYFIKGMEKILIEMNVPAKDFID